MTIAAIQIGDAPDLETFLADRIYEFNAAATGYHDAESFAASCRSDSGGITAGITGFTWGGCCFVSYLWVSTELRGRGIGSELLSAAELHAREKGCRVVIVSSHSFQAPDFYARRGYETVARIRDYPVGYDDIVLVKRLDAPIARSDDSNHR